MRGKVTLRPRTLPSTQEERVAYNTTFTLHSHYIGGRKQKQAFPSPLPVSIGVPIGSLDSRLLLFLYALAPFSAESRQKSRQRSFSRQLIHWTGRAADTEGNVDADHRLRARLRPQHSLHTRIDRPLKSGGLRLAVAASALIQKPSEVVAWARLRQSERSRRSRIDTGEPIASTVGPQTLTGSQQEGFEPS